MTANLRARIAEIIGQHCPDHYEQHWEAAADKILALVQPIVDDLAIAEQHIEEGNDETLKAYAWLRRAEAERDRLRTGVEAMWTRWFANAHAGLGFRQAMDGIGGDLRRILDGEPEHVCRPDADLYFCPTAGEVESAVHGGFDVCCAHPELHQPVDERTTPNNPPTSSNTTNNPKEET